MGWIELSRAQRAPDDARTLAAAARECDAHALWACLSDFDCYLELPRVGGKRMVPVLVEVDGDANQRAQIARLIGKPAAYDIGEAFYTGQVSRENLLALHGKPGVRGWRIGLPLVRDAIAGEAAPLAASMPAGIQPVPVAAPDDTLPLVGIIDHGIAVAHAAFRRGRGGPEPRLLALWDQDAYRCRNEHWQQVAELGYGGELSAAMLAGLIAATGDDERSIYERIDYAPVQRVVSHGTHVLDLAAGDPHPLTPIGLAAEDEQRHWSGAASRAGIIAVQLPCKPQKDTSGSALPVHVLDALHYIAARAGARDVVVNLSDGGYGGPHDGCSMLERAIDRYLERKPNVVLVLAAGNAHEDRLHASVPALAAGQAHALHWQVLPADATPSFVEVWFDRELRAGDATLQVVAADGTASGEVALGDAPRVLVDDTGRIVAAVIGRLQNPNGVRRGMFLLALAPTARVRTDRGTAPHGRWTLTVRNAQAAGDPVRVDAWIERDTPAINDPGPWRQSFFDDDACAPQSVDSRRTLGSLAGSGQAVVVASHYRRHAAFGGCDPAAMTAIARYSSRGPDRAGDVRGPDVAAPGDESPVSSGLRAAASRSGATARLSGTSVAAPLVTRRIVNLLAAGAAATVQAGAGARVKALLVPCPSPDPAHDGSRGRVVPGEEPVPSG
jgi:hypothetical protein